MGETIVVVVKVTSLTKDGLKNVEIWEKPDFDGLKIINASYPIKASSIGQIFDYEVSDRSFLNEEDIANLTYIVSVLRYHDNYIYSHIYSLMSKDSQDVLNNRSSNSSQLKKVLISEFNKIINNNSYSNLNATLVSRGNKPLNYLYIKTYKPQSWDYLNLKDYRLIKRRLLEDIFPETNLYPPALRRLSFFKEHELLIPENCSQKFIRYPERGIENLEEDQAIILKYYLTPRKVGMTKIRSVIRSEGILNEETTHIKVIERNPQFDIQYFVDSKEIVVNQIKKFIYTIEYLGGDLEEKDFAVKITYPNNTIEDRNLSFTKGETKKIVVNVIYNKPGDKLSPPTISIGAFQKDFESDISVYNPDDLEAKRSYEYTSLNQIRYTNYISVAALFLLVIELYFLIRQEKQNEATLKNLADALSNLSGINKKKDKDS